SRPPLALIANDEEWSIRSLESILAPNGYAILRAYNAQQAIELARETTPDLIILDDKFPEMSGVDVCRILREDPRITPCTPILLTTAGRRGRQERLDALATGAWELIGLPVDAEELLLKLAAYMASKFAADQTREESLVDELTGLYNLRGLMRRARELGSDAFRHSRALACVAFAPDVPSANAAAEPGEELWGAVDRLGRVFKMSGRVSDAIGRIRLGEFVVIAPATDEAKALKLAERLVRTAEITEDAEARLKVLAGYDAVSDFREAGIQPAALLAGATLALRRCQAEPGGEAIRRYDGDREGTTPLT
ncbi:MAG: response regulator, partial [Gemmatimonadota bacterium]